MSSDFGKLQPGVFEGAVQSLLECRRRLRDVESILEGLLPLAEGDAAAKLEEIREAVAKASYATLQLYNRNAKEAFRA